MSLSLLLLLSDSGGIFWWESSSNGSCLFCSEVKWKVFLSFVELSKLMSLVGIDYCEGSCDGFSEIVAGMMLVNGLRSVMRCCKSCLRCCFTWGSSADCFICSAAFDTGFAGELTKRIWLSTGGLILSFGRISWSLCDTLSVMWRVLADADSMFQQAKLDSFYGSLTRTFCSTFQSFLRQSSELEDYPIHSSMYRAVWPNHPFLFPKVPLSWLELCW